MKLWGIFVSGIFVTGVVIQAQTVVIDSLGTNGKLTATVPSNAVYSVEWIGALNSTNGWQQGWSHLRGQQSTDGVVEVEVPMAFRLSCWTNGVLVNAPVGRTYLYTRTNQDGETWTNEVQVMGDTYIPSQTNSYRTIWSEDWYAEPSLIPVGAQPRGAVFVRADESAAYFIDSGVLPGQTHENLVWTNGPVGTTWSYFDSTPHTTIHSEIMAITNLTIGSTTYEDCIEIHSVGDPQTWLTDYPTRELTQWIQPGGYVVMSKNWWLETEFTNAAPIVTELQGWTDE